jgi:hypothetical protein
MMAFSELLCHPVPMVLMFVGGGLNSAINILERYPATHALFGTRPIFC